MTLTGHKADLIILDDVDALPHRPIESSTSPLYRLKQEAQALQEKLTGLQAYMGNNPQFAELPVREVALMIQQEAVMRHYLLILQSRGELMILRS